MKYGGLPWGMWVLYRRSFRKHLVSDLGLSSSEAKRVMVAAKPNYKKIIAKLPEFEKSDQFDVNIVNCALLIAFLQAMSTRPDIESLTEFYANAMMNPPTRWFFRMMGKQKFTDKDIQEAKDTSALKAADRNPYSWNMDYLPYEDGSGYEDRFYACGICTLMKEYGFYDLTPVMCHLDFVMGEASGTYQFVRKYTLVSGGPYCDCGYKKINKAKERKRH